MAIMQFFSVLFNNAEIRNNVLCAISDPLRRQVEHATVNLSFFITIQFKAFEREAQS